MSTVNQIHLDLPPLPTAAGEMEDSSEVDRHHKLPKLTYRYIGMFIWDILLIFFSMLLYFADSASDIYLAWHYYMEGYNLYFALTLLFVTIPGIVVAGFSVLLYILDTDVRKQPNPTRNSLQWIFICTIFSVVQLGPILRDVETLAYKFETLDAVKKRNQKGYTRSSTLMEKEESDAAFLRLFERFMEAAPQVTLQLFVFIHHFHDPKMEINTLTLCVVIPLSLLSLANSLTALNRTSRVAQEGKENLSCMGIVLQFIWHLSIITSRVFALAIFASAYPIFIFPFCIIHWIVMFQWLRMQTPHRSQQLEGRTTLERFLDSLPNLVIAFIYIFVYFNTRDEPTRNKCWFFYTLCFLENTIFIFISIFLPQHKEFFYFVVSSYGLFFLGIFLMWIYYRWFHPSNRFTSTYSAIKYMVFISREPRVSNSYS